MARTAMNSHKLQLEKMAETWEQLAESRKRQMAKEGRSDEEDTSSPG